MSKTYISELNDKKENCEKLIEELTWFKNTLYLDLVIEALQDKIDSIDNELRTDIMIGSEIAV